jgi:outer membrane lipoprotein-sorting protein
MRCFLSILLVPTLAPIVLAQDKDAEKLFRGLENKIMDARALQINVDIELRAIKGREGESKLKDKVGRAHGILILTKDNKARLRISGEYVGMEMVSNGKQMKLAGDEAEPRSIDEAEAKPTPAHLHSLDFFVSRAGVTTSAIALPFLLKSLDVKLKEGMGDPGRDRLAVSDFKMDAAKIGGREVKVVSYRFGAPSDKDSPPVTLWIDAKTLLPIKRVIVLENENLHITETYTTFNLDPRTGAKDFEMIPWQGNEAEKLFRAVEEKIKAAKAVQVAFDVEVKSRRTEGKLKGSLLFTKDSQARLKMNGNDAGKEITIELVCDGKRMKFAESPDTIAGARAEAAPANLHDLLCTVVSGPGLLPTYDLLVPEAPQFRLVAFNLGAAEKVGGRDTKVITMDAVLLGGTCQVTVWIDAETLLPVKRLVVAEEENTIRATETCTFTLNPKVEAGAFTLPK